MQKLIYIFLAVSIIFAACRKEEEVTIDSTWNCVNGTCLDPGTGNGTYTSLSSCESNCMLAQPGSALAQAQLIEAELGPIPTFNCEDGVLIPIYVNGIEVFVDQPTYECDNPDLKGECLTGSRVGRIQGTNQDGSIRPEVVWVFFCRRGDNFAQMIGYNEITGKTAFLELNDGYLPTNAFLQPNVYVPTPNDPTYEAAWKAPAEIAEQGCNSCHTSDAFIHSRWIAGAKLPSNPNEPVLPEVATPHGKYCVIGNEFSSWELSFIDLPENNCLGCHRLSNINAWNFANNTDWDLYMPPNNPGSMSADYQEIKDFIQNFGPFEIAPNSTAVPPCDE